MTNDKPVTVTQADRDAAAWALDQAPDSMTWERLTAAHRTPNQLWQANRVAEAFARHRTTHAPSQPAAPDDDEQYRPALQAMRDALNGDGGENERLIRAGLAFAAPPSQHSDLADDLISRAEAMLACCPKPKEAWSRHAIEGMDTCIGCVHAKQNACTRDGLHPQAYETKFTDSDFCGPNRRYFTPVHKGTPNDR